MGNQIWEEWTIILEKNHRWKFTSSTAAALFRSGTFGNKVPKVAISFQGPSPYVVLLRELIPFFQWFLSRKYYPLLISSTVIVPIIHIKNKAGVCSSILKIKMKNENCHKRELGSKTKQHFGLSVVWVPAEMRFSNLCSKYNNNLSRGTLKAAPYINLLKVLALKNCSSSKRLHHLWLMCKQQTVSASFWKVVERWKSRHFWFSSEAKCSGALNRGSARLGITVHGFCSCCCFCCTHTKVFLVVQLFTKLGQLYIQVSLHIVCLHPVCLCLLTQMLIWLVTPL